MRVKESALIKRVNGKLEARGEKLRKTRGQENIKERGGYWLQDVLRNLVLQKSVELTTIARDLGISLK